MLRIIDANERGIATLSGVAGTDPERFRHRLAACPSDPPLDPNPLLAPRIPLTSSGRDRVIASFAHSASPLNRRSAADPLCPIDPACLQAGVGHCVSFGDTTDQQDHPEGADRRITSEHDTICTTPRIGPIGCRMDAPGHVSATPDDRWGRQAPLEHRTSPIYDPLRQAVPIEGACGYFTSLPFDPAGLRVRYADAVNLPTTFIYENLKRPSGKVVLDIDRAVPALEAQRQSPDLHDFVGIVSYLYAPDGRCVGVRSLDGKTLTYVYDPSGNRIGMIGPDGKLTSHSWEL